MDLPRTCERCKRTTIHRPDERGELHCMTCLAAPRPPPIPTKPVAPPVTHVVVQKQGDGVVVGTIKLAMFIVAVVFLLGIGTCVAICGSAATSTKNSPSPVTPEREPERPRAIESDPWKR